MATIDHYSFGRIVVDGVEYSKDVIILPERVRGEWWRKDGHGLVLEDFKEVIHELPEYLVVGTGAHGQMKPDPQALAELEERGIKVDTLPTGDAVARYLELDPRNTAAALHLTC
ncbi:MAG: MTH938/NDUFAF3 family protein [Actinomycetota bacterium]